MQRSFEGEGLSGEKERVARGLVAERVAGKWEEGMGRRKGGLMAGMVAVE